MLSQQAIERAAEKLRRGEAVILPTDTVPGLFALDTPLGEAKLKALKPRDEAKPLARMFGSLRELLARVEIETPLQKLALERLLPGRVTLVLPDARRNNKTLGVRLPMDAALRALIRITGPLLATSANISGVDPGDSTLSTHLREGVALVLEDEFHDASIRPAASTVIDLTRSVPVILRKGAVSLWTVARRLDTSPCLAAPQELNVIFVCGGNTCRSPMAAAIFKSKCQSRRVNVRSAGLSASRGAPAAANALGAMAELGLSLTNHLSFGVDEELLNWADLVLVMTRDHLLRMRRRYPASSDKSFLLSGFPAPWPHGRDIEDPLGSTIETYRNVARQIQSYMTSICAEVVKALTGLD